MSHATREKKHVTASANNGQEVADFKAESSQIKSKHKVHIFYIFDYLFSKSLMSLHLCMCVEQFK